MSALVILIPVSLVLLGIAVGAFFWAVNRGQFDDLDTPPLRILEDDPEPGIPDGENRKPDGPPG